MKLDKDAIIVDPTTRRLEKTFNHVKFDIRDGKRYIRNPNDYDKKPAMTETKNKKGKRFFKSVLSKALGDG